MLNCEQMNESLSGYLDDELTQQQHQQIDLHLQACESCSGLLNQMRELCGAVGQSGTSQTLDDQHWQRIKNDAMSNQMQSVGWVLLGVYGLLVCGLAIWGSLMFLADGSIPIVVKLLCAALFLGMSLLFGAVLRQRMIVYKTDKYRKVKI